MTDLRQNLRREAADACETEALISKASGKSLFAKVSAINACKENPYQPSTIWYPSIFGCMMQLDLRETVSQQIFLTGTFEADILWLLTCLVDEGSLVVDCGAHIGFFTIAFSKLVGSSGRVEAFEPTATTKISLEVNIKNANASNVNIHPLAVWSESKVIDFNDYGPEFSAYNSIGAARVGNDLALPVKSIMKISAIALDEFLRASDIAPSFIKLDVENAEYQALIGLRYTIENHRPLIVIEIGDIINNKEIHSTADTLSVLTNYSYKIFDIKGCRLTLIDTNLDKTYDYGNVLAVPNERIDEILARTNS